MAKKKRKKTSKNKTNILKYIAWFLSIIALVLVVGIGAYYIGYKSGKKTAQKQHTHKVKKQQHKKTDQRKQLQKILQKESKKTTTIKTYYNTASHEIDTKDVQDVIKTPKKTVHKTTKPKLAIIIDDVCIKSQIQAIKSLHIPITMSFLPPSPARPNSAKLASKESFYMVHLPMEAMHWNKEEPWTLHAEDSSYEIEKRIKKIKQLFPRVRYINNHTGSKFTANEDAMNKLIYTLNKYHIYFIDSRTTAQTKVPKVMKNYGLRYMARDVFLDHHPDKEYVKNQIKQAIKIAKLHGSAIAIGHPHANTLEAIKESKQLFRDVKLVLVNQL